MAVVYVGDVIHAYLGRENGARGSDGPVFFDAWGVFWVNGTLRGTWARLTVSGVQSERSQSGNGGGRLSECQQQVCADPILNGDR